MLFDKPECLKNLASLYVSLKQTWTLSKIYSDEKIKGVKKFQTQHPEQFQTFLNQKIYNDEIWMNPGYLIARYGPQHLFEYLARFIKEEPVHSNGYTLLHAVASIYDENVRDPRLQFLISDCGIKNVNVLDNYGRTYLFYLHDTDWSQCLEAADCSILDNFGVCAAEYRYFALKTGYCFILFEKSGVALLKRALQYNDPHLVYLVIDKVDISDWLYSERLKANMLRASYNFYCDTIVKYLAAVIPPDILADGSRLFHFIDDFMSSTFGSKSSQRKKFICYGLGSVPLLCLYRIPFMYDSQKACFLKFCDLILQRKRFSSWWQCAGHIFDNIVNGFIKVANSLEYARRFSSLYPIKDKLHWLYILNWLYVSKEDHNLLRRVVQLRDVYNNTVLHIIAEYDPWLDDKFLAYEDLEWIETCILKMGADIDALNNNKETPLFVAMQIYKRSWEDNRNLCRLLIKYGAHLDVRNKNNETIEHLLKQKLGISIELPLPLQCLAARKCKKIPFLPDIINKIIELH